MAEGYIYIQINTAFKKNCLKIGRTTRDPEIRSVEMSQGTGVPLPFYVAYSKKTFDCETAERRIHQKLARCRVSDSREFFALPLEDAITQVRAVCESIISTSELLSKASTCLEEKKHEKAIPYWELAAERGSAEAQYYLCQMYMEGWGGLDDYDVGLSYLEKAANQGYGKAELELAEHYAEELLGGEHYAEKAIYWGARAAEHGFIQAAAIVGNMYAVECPGVEKNNNKALYWFRKAADSGDAYAQYQVGIFYEFGFGVEKNLENAFCWYRKSKESGYKTTQERKLVSILHIPRKSHYLPSPYIKAIYEKKFEGICSSSYKYINIKDAEELLEDIPENKRPIFQHGFSINEDTERTCMHPGCLYRGIIEFGNIVYCIEHYYTGLPPASG